MQKDGSLFPASSTLDARSARARWATCVAGFFFDGPWNIGVVVGSLKEFTDKVGVAPIPRPTGTSNPIHNGPTGRTFWISSQSKHADIASGVLKLFTTPEYYVGLAGQMDQPPLDLNAVDKANVHPTYKQAIGFYKNEVRLAPDPVARNPVVALVEAEMKVIHPNLGELTQGVFSGDVKDSKAALQTVSTELYEAARADGANAWHVFWDITVPLLKPFALIIGVLTLIDTFQVFDLMLTMTGGGPFFSTEVIDIFIYRMAFAATIPRLGYASAAAVAFGVIMLIFALLQLLVFRKARSGRKEAACWRSAAAAMSRRSSSTWAFSAGFRAIWKKRRCSTVPAFWRCSAR